MGPTMHNTKAERIWAIASSDEKGTTINFSFMNGLSSLADIIYSFNSLNEIYSGQTKISVQTDCLLTSSGESQQ